MEREAATPPQEAASEATSAATGARCGSSEPSFAAHAKCKPAQCLSMEANAGRLMSSLGLQKTDETARGGGGGEGDSGGDTT